MFVLIDILFDKSLEKWYIKYKKENELRYIVLGGITLMSDKKPLYKQIMDKLKERIKSGDFEYDAPFVTEDRITK